VYHKDAQYKASDFRMRQVFSGHPMDAMYEAILKLEGKVVGALVPIGAVRGATLMTKEEFDDTLVSWVEIGGVRVVQGDWVELLMRVPA